MILHRVARSFFEVDCVERDTQRCFTWYSSLKTTRIVCHAVKHLLNK